MATSRTYQPKKIQRPRSTASARECPLPTAARFLPVVVHAAAPVSPTQEREQLAYRMLQMRGNNEGRLMRMCFDRRPLQAIRTKPQQQGDHA